MAKKKKATRRKKRQRRVESDTILMDLVDEIDAIDMLLRAFPDIERSARLLGSPMTPPSADPLARWAREKHGIDLNEAVEESEDDCDTFANLSDLPNAPDVLVDTARWRMRRVGQLLQLIIRGDTAR